MSLGTFLANPLGSLTGQFLGSGQQGTIWNNNGDKYQIPSATESANQFSGTGLDPNGLVAGLWNDITGQTAQSREFAQQEYLQDKMNAYNHPVEEMNRQKEAGINPNLTAAGIAQAGSQSAQAPAVASNTSGVANGLAAAAGTIASLGTGAQGFAGALETKKLLSANFNKINSETIANLEAAGLSHWNAVSVATMLPYMEANSAADFYLKLAQYDRTHQEYVNLLAEHDKILSDIDLNSATMDLMEQQRLKEAEMTRWYKLENDFFEAHGYHSDNPLDVSLRNSVVTGRSDEANSIGTAIETASNRAAQGSYSAQASNAYDVAYNETAGKYAADSDYAELNAYIEANSQYLKNAADLMTKAPSTIRGGFFQFMFTMLMLAGELSDTEAGLTGGKPSKPPRP